MTIGKTLTGDFTKPARSTPLEWFGSEGAAVVWTGLLNRWLAPKDDAYSPLLNHADAMPRAT